MNVLAGSDPRLTVVLDIRQPLAYLALHPVSELAKECAIGIDYLPIVDSPLKAPSLPGTHDDRGIRHRRIRAQAVAREIETYAAVQNLTLAEYYRDPDPTLFNRAWLWVHDQRPDRLLKFLSDAFRAYWAVELDIEDPGAITGQLDSVDADARAFEAWPIADRRRAENRVAEDWRERGVGRAPSYLIDNEVFVGRQHLPMIRWILEGRVGAGPI